MRNALLMLIMVFSSGCAEVATNLAIQGGIDYTREQYLIAHNKPYTRCNMANMVRGNNMCRVYRQYRRVT